MKWRESLIVVALVAVTSVLILRSGSDESDEASQVATTEPQPPPGVSLIERRSSREEMTAASTSQLGANPTPENPLPFELIEGVTVPPVSGTPLARQGMIRAHPEVAEAVKQRLMRSQEIELLVVKRALDSLELDPVILNNILEEIALSQGPLIDIQMAEARGDVTFQEYWDEMSNLIPSAIVSRYLTTPQMIEFDRIMMTTMPSQDEARAREGEARMADIETQIEAPPQ